MPKKQTGTLISADGTTRNIVPNNGREFSLIELQTFVGGYIELASTRDNRLMYLNEEGKQKNLPINLQATKLYRFGHLDPVVGDVVVIEEKYI